MTKFEVDRMVDKMIREVGASNNETTRKFYCKAIYKLEQNVIWNHIETAKKAKKSKPGLLHYLLNSSLASKENNSTPCS